MATSPHSQRRPPLRALIHPSGQDGGLPYELATRTDNGAHLVNSIVQGLTISASLGAGDPDRRQGGRHADTTRIRGFRFMRDLRNYGVCGYCSIGQRYAARSQRRRHAKDLVADRRSSAGLCDGTCGSDNRAGSAARATHASGNRIRLCLGRWFRASHTRSTDPHTQSRRCLPNTARNAPCGWKGWRRQVQNSYHLCCGEGKTPRISSLSICESGAHLFAAWCLRII
jgi:hypothetical protein